MNVRFLETFVWVARLRSFSVAADKLCTTQASVSNRIATLERELGVRLFERDARAVRLTPQGQRALASAEEIVKRVSEFRTAIGDNLTMRGTIRIGTIDSLVYAWIPKLIRRMNSQYPNVSIDLCVDTSLQVAQEVQDGNIDLGLIMGPVIAPNMRNEPLCTYETHWVASLHLPFPDRQLQFADLAVHPLLAYSKGSIPHLAMQRLADKAGVEAAQLRFYNTNSIATHLKLLTDQIGIAAMPYAVVRDSLERGDLRTLDVAVKAPSLSFHAVYVERPDEFLTAIVAGMAVEIASEDMLTETAPQPLA